MSFKNKHAIWEQLPIRIHTTTYRQQKRQSSQDTVIDIHLFAMRIGISSIEFDIKPLI